MGQQERGQGGRGNLACGQGSAAGPAAEGVIRSPSVLTSVAGSHWLAACPVGYVLEAPFLSRHLLTDERQLHTAHCVSTQGHRMQNVRSSLHQAAPAALLSHAPDMPPLLASGHAQQAAYLPGNESAEHTPGSHERPLAPSACNEHSRKGPPGAISRPAWARQKQGLAHTRCTAAHTGRDRHVQFASP